MATPENRSPYRRHPGIVVGASDAGAARAVPGGSRAPQGSSPGQAGTSKPTLIDGQLPITEPRCGGRLPGKGLGDCVSRSHCARYTQMAKDRASGRTDYVDVPVWWTCSKGGYTLDTPGYVADDEAMRRTVRAASTAKPKPKKRHPWKSPPPSAPVIKTPGERAAERQRKTVSKLRQWGPT